MILRIWFLLIFCFLQFALGDFPEYERANINFTSGSILFQSALNRNIFLKTSGTGKILINGTDVTDLPTEEELNSFVKTQRKMHQILQIIDILQEKEASENVKLEKVYKYRERVSNLYLEIDSIRQWSIDQIQIDTQRQAEIEKLQQIAERIRETMGTDYCELNACKNGATCIPQYGGFFCRCPKEFQGDTCETDYNECENQIPGGLCQNNGTCVNFFGGYRCECAKGFYGSSCSIKNPECEINEDLCGEHGTCLSDSSKPSGFTCDCFPGYQISNDPKNPICVDVDECHSNPCHPGVECLNLHGSFECKGCPPGFEKAGTNCVDINECEKFHACDKRVECINTLGSYKCTACPQGFLGDPKIGCTENPDKCDPDPCPEIATCTTVDNSYSCTCPDGYIGGSNYYGGIHECVLSNITICDESKCLNGGTCRMIKEDKFRCDCPKTYIGQFCELASPCYTNPCQNGGICKVDQDDNEAYCDCPYNFYGDQCEIEEELCDRHFSTSKGSFTFERGISTDCKFVFNIHAAENHALHITFTDYNEFNRYPHGATNCSNTTGRLEVYDGPGVNYHKMAVFCGNQMDDFSPKINQPIKFSSSSAMFLFRGTSGMFSISWSIEQKNCGYRTTAPEGIIKLPANTEGVSCEWFIIAPTSKVIEITIPPIEMFTGEENDCYKNELALHDGFFRNYENIVETICSNSLETVIRKTISPHLTVSFYTEKNDQTAGFSMRYKFVEPEYECGGHFENKENELGFSGQIRSPNFDGLYPPNVHCFYTINMTHKTQMRISFVFDMFDVVSDHGKRDCTQGDVLRIETQDGHNWPFCNGPFSTGFSLHLPMQFMTLNFTTNSENQGRGFDIAFKVECEQKLQGNGSLQTWNYPRGGMSGECSYHFNTESHQLTTLKFFKTDIPTRVLDCGSGGTIEIRSELVHGEFFNTELRCVPPTIDVNGEFTIIIKETAESMGHSFEYSTIDIGCGGVFTDDEGTITSPGYPSNTYNNLNCIYLIETSPSQSIVLTFDDIDIGRTSSMKCQSDYIGIHDDFFDLTSPGSLIRQICGSQRFPPIHSRTNRLAIQLVTQSGKPVKGFSVTYKVVNSTTTCDQTFFGESGEIFVTYNDTKFEECNYHIKAPEHRTMRIELVWYNLTSGDLMIFNGRDKHSNLQYHPYFASGEKTFISFYDQVFVRTFNYKEPLRGSFKITYQVVSNRCGGRITEHAGDVLTPQYPHAERRTLHCEWLITVPAGNWIRFKFRDINVQERQLQVYDITNVRNEKRLKYDFPENGKNFDVTATANQVKIAYHQYSSIYDDEKYFGFAARFEIICEDVVLEEMSGMIEIMMPMSMLRERSCNYEIRVPLGNRVMVHFHQFESQPLSGYDGIYRFEINSEDFNSSVVNTNGTILQNSPINIFNKTIKPISIISQHNTLRLNFSTRLTRANKISLTYRAVGCVGELKTPQNIIVSRENLDPNATRIECEYRIIAPIGKTVTVYVNKFNKILKGDCKYQANDTFNGAAFFMGDSRDFGEPFKTVCNPKKTIKGYTNELFIYMSFDVTEFKNQKENLILNATVEFPDFANQEDESSCGGSFELYGEPYKIVVTPQLPNNVTCNWNFKIPPGTHLEFTLENYVADYQGYWYCDVTDDWDYGKLTISDSEKEVKTFCRPTTSPEVFEVYSTMAKVVFTSPRYKAKKEGFVLTARSVCGGVILATKTNKHDNIYQDRIGICNITIKKSSEDDDQLFVDLLSIHEPSAEEMTSTITVYADGELKGVTSAYHKTSLHYTAKKEILLSVDQKTKREHLGYFKYRTSQTGCSNFEVASEGIITAPDSEIDQPIDCTWKIFQFGETFATFALEYHNIPENPHCSESYIEVRDGTKPGEVLSRQCDPNAVDLSEFKAEYFYITLRYRPTPASKGTKIKFQGRYTISAGGFVKSRSIITPYLAETQVFTWITDLGNETMRENVEGIRVDVTDLRLGADSYVEIAEISDDLVKGEVLKTLTKEDNDVDQHVVSYSSMVQITAKSNGKDDYNITWEPFNQTNRHKIAGYECGEELTATWEWQIIEAPRDVGVHGYKANVHCKWLVHATQFNKIEYELLQIDFNDEGGDDCDDFIYFVEEWDNQEKPRAKICEIPKHWQEYRTTSSFNLHFVSDKDASNNNGGFKIRYRLRCGKFARIPRSSINQYEITSPNYPLSMNQSELCVWFLMAESRRELSAQVVDMDIREEQPCSNNNSLGFSRLHWPYNYTNFCGHIDQKPIDFTFNKFDMVIRYAAENSQRRGFKLLLTENVTECIDGTIYLTETNPSRVIYSPNYPAKIPTSTECEYVVSVPHGHRIMVTFDHEEFNLLNDHKEFTEFDFIELRDGPIEHSPSLGKYQGHEVPPTTFSSSNYMYMKLSTNWRRQLGGFVARFEIARCGGTKIIYNPEEVFYITAPKTETDLDCQWIVRSPSTHSLKMKFERVSINHGSNCPKQQLVVYNGDVSNLPFFENNCSAITDFKWILGLYSEITITYKFSYDADVDRFEETSQFRIAFKLSNLTCGGDVTNDDGELVPPVSYVGLSTRVRCVWNLQSTPGFTYRLKIRFHGDNFYSYDEKKNDTCFPDLKIREKTGNKNLPKYVEQTFCKSSKELDLWTLGGEVIYEDTPSFDSRATENVSSFSIFVVFYEKIPTPPSSCTRMINTSQTIVFDSTVPRAELCLLSIVKPAKYGTVAIKISDFGTVNKKIRCENLSITSKSDSHPSFEDYYCSSFIRNKTLDFVYTNERVDLTVFEDHLIRTQNNNYSISINFSECGGLIDRSTNFGNISMPDSTRCRWDFEAPVGQIIKIKVVTMNIPTSPNCEHIALYVREGRHDEQGLLHMYCHSTSNPTWGTQPLRDEYRVIKSKTRFLNIEWVRNTPYDKLDWVLEYSYIDEGDECGFHSSALSGLITTPNFGDKTYENNLECLWDIHVPPGYHIKLKYVYFELEASDGCVKDSLTITEASQSMDSVLLDHWAIQPFEEVKYPKVCGHHTPKDTFASTTRRLKLNFTTDDTVTSNGFKIEWEAECGAILTKEHGTVTSPNYPQGYPRDTCGYIIQADPEDIVSLKFEDVDLPIRRYFGNKCYDANIQIVEIPSNKILLTICGDENVPKELLTFRGTVGINFNLGFLFKKDLTKLSAHRGFKLTYQREVCGKSIHLDDKNRQYYISSPVYPLVHKHYLDCHWNVTTTRDRYLSYKFISFELDESSNCESDYVLVSFGGLKLKQCGGQDDISYETTHTWSSTMAVRLVTDAKNNGKGFLMKVVSSLGPKQGCGGWVLAGETWKSLQPPKDKDGNYLPHLHCFWKFGADFSTIQLQITDLDIEKDARGCSYDYIRVIDGTLLGGIPLTDRICGNQTLPITINSTGDSMSLEFVTDVRDGGKGFNVSYISRNNTSCRRGLKPVNEPATYRFEAKTEDLVDQHKCFIWMMSDEQTQITFNEIDFKSCDEGFVEIQCSGVSGDTHQTIKLCNNQTFTFTTTHSIALIVTTKNFDKPRAVEFTYQKVNKCNRTIDTNSYPSGRVTSNIIVKDERTHSECTTTLGNPKDLGHSKKLLLAFKVYPSEGAKIRARNTDHIHKFHHTYYSNGAELNITVNSISKLKSKPYDATYFTVAETLDDGTIIFAENSDASGVVTNIGYPNGYPSSTTQIFTIRPPNQTPCSIHLETVSMNIRSNCTSPATDEYLTFDVQQPTGPKNFDECEFSRYDEHRVNLNGNDGQRVFRFTFKSDDIPDNDGRGFKITWICDVNLKVSRRSEVWL